MSCLGVFTVPKGFRHHPSDVELLSDLEMKNQCEEDSQITGIIPEINPCEHEPGELPELAFRRAEILKRRFFFHFYFWFTVAASWESQGRCFFFARRECKFPNSNRSKRATGEGFWKVTGKDRAIKAPGSNAVIGWKRILTFYKRGEEKPQKTGWVIHEYFLVQKHSDPPQQIGKFVVCCLKYKADNSGDAPFCGRGISSCSVASNVEYQAEENWVSDEAQITKAEENETLKQLADKLEVPFGNQGTQTDPCPITEGPPDTEMLLHNTESLYSVLDAPAQPQLHQPHQLPMCTTNVHNGGSCKRTCSFEDNGPSPKKKNSTSTYDEDKLVSNCSSSSENQAANVIPEGENLGLDFDSFLYNDYAHTPPSINRGPRDISHDNDFIEWNDLGPLCEGTDSSLVSHTVIDGGSRVTGDENSEVVHGSVNDYPAFHSWSNAPV